MTKGKTTMTKKKTTKRRTSDGRITHTSLSGVEERPPVCEDPKPEPAPPLEVETLNAQVDKIKIGTATHADRSFMTIGVHGCGWEQTITVRLSRAMDLQGWIDQFILVCGASDLWDCQGRYVRVTRPKNSGSDQPIISMTHIVQDAVRVSTGILEGHGYWNAMRDAVLGMGAAYVAAKLLQEKKR